MAQSTFAAAALATGGVGSTAWAADPKAAPHAHGHGSAGLSSVQAKASDCVDKGDVCLQHCLEMLSTGDKAMADCAKSVRELLVFCGALAKAAAQKSPRLKELAAISYSVCKECETACLKHKEMAVCKECADACAACAKECKSLA